MSAQVVASSELAHMEGVVLTASEQRAVSAFWDGVIRDVMAEVEASVADGPVPSARLRSADEGRAVRREARRGRGAAVRSLRLRGAALFDTDGEDFDGIDDVMGEAA